MSNQPVLVFDWHPPCTSKSPVEYQSYLGPSDFEVCSLAEALMTPHGHCTGAATRSCVDRPICGPIRSTSGDR
jgi:hypothetical protein